MADHLFASGRFHQSPSVCFQGAPQSVWRWCHFSPTQPTQPCVSLQVTHTAGVMAPRLNQTQCQRRCIALSSPSCLSLEVGPSSGCWFLTCPSATTTFSPDPNRTANHHLYCHSYCHSSSGNLFETLVPWAHSSAFLQVRCSGPKTSRWSQSSSSCSTRTNPSTGCWITSCGSKFATQRKIM